MSNKISINHLDKFKTQKEKQNFIIKSMQNNISQMTITFE
jgi:hypothetical protein